MGPLVYYCRWRGAKLRLHGRDGHSVWGELVIAGDNDARSESFRFDLQTWKLTLSDGEDQQRLQLDELGVVVPPGGWSATTSADAEP